MHTCGCYRLQVGHTCTSRAEGRFVADGKRGVGAYVYIHVAEFLCTYRLTLISTQIKHGKQE